MSHRGPAFWGHQDVNSWRKHSLKCPWGCSESSPWHDIHSLLQQKQWRRFVSRLREVARSRGKLVSLEKKADLSLSPPHHTQDPHLFSLIIAGKGSLEPMKRADKIHAPRGRSPRALATAHISSCQLGLNQMPGEKWVSFLTLLCCDWALRAVVVLTDSTTKFRLNHQYDLGYCEYQCA